MPGKTRTVAEIIEEHKKECNHFVNGKCSTLACMERNWTTPFGQEGCYRFVGCLSYQTVETLLVAYDPQGDDISLNEQGTSLEDQG